MNDPYIITLVGGGFSLLGVLVGSLIQIRFRKSELDRIETFQQILSKQNSQLLAQLKKDELEKIEFLTEKIYNRIGEIPEVLKRTNSQMR
jgi:tRNA A37 N6-isopentenylltransferase MiaA